MASQSNRKVSRKSTSHSSVHRKALRLHGVIARDLGVGIVSGRYKPGAVLGNEIEADRKSVV